MTKYTATIRLDGHDFDRLCENSGDLRQAFPSLYERLRDGGQQAHMRHQWRQIYWTGTQYAHLLLARSFLDAIGEEYQVVADEGSDERGESFGWAILTDYLSPAWQDQASQASKEQQR